MKLPSFLQSERVYPSAHYNMDIHVRDLSASDRIGKKVLDSVSLYIPQGTHTIITGPSGAGKTVLATAIAKMPAPKDQLAYSGTVKYLMEPKDKSREPVYLSNKYPIKKRNLSFVSQQPFFDSAMTVEDEITLDADMKGVDVNIHSEFMQNILSILKLDDRLDAPMTALSGGQQQRVMIAAALSINPNILVMDEPTSNLDVKTKHEVNDTVTDLVNKLGVTALIVTHDELTAPHEIHVVDGKVVSNTLNQ